MSIVRASCTLHPQHLHVHSIHCGCPPFSCSAAQSIYAVQNASQTLTCELCSTAVSQPAAAIVKGVAAMPCLHGTGATDQTSFVGMVACIIPTCEHTCMMQLCLGLCCCAACLAADRDHAHSMSFRKHNSACKLLECAASSCALSDEHIQVIT